MLLSLLLSLPLYAPLLIRKASVDITPPEPLQLGGYTARGGKVMSGVGDHLFARALVLEQGPARIDIVSVDMLTVPDSLFKAVAAKLPSDVHLFLCATHTHCAPDSQMLNDRMTFSIPGIATYRRRWLTFYSEKIAQAAHEALAAHAESALGLKISQWQADANRGRRKLAMPSKTATLISSTGKDAAGLIFSYEAHPTFYDDDENMTRQDWPGGVGNLADLVLVGAIGDVSPKALGKDKATPAEKIATFWKTILAGKNSAKTFSFRARSNSLSFLVQPIILDPVVAHPTFASAYKIPPPLADNLVKKFAPTAASISAVRFGDLALVGVPGEPSAELGKKIVEAGKRLGYKSVVVLSHCNGWIGYILAPDDYDRGGYEATLGFYGRNEGLNVVAASSAALAQLRSISQDIKN